MLKLWGQLSSINVRKVVYAAQLLGLPFQRIDAGAAFGITCTPDYLARNPNALVPLLEDDAYRLWESNVIVRYLCERLTMADMPIACEMHRWWGLPLPHGEHPHLRRWYDGLLGMPAARGVLDLPLT